MVEYFLKIQRKCSDLVYRYTTSQYSVAILAMVAFTESSFFVVPPDILLIAMSMVMPSRAIFYAFITTLFSVLGGLLGYAIGFFFFEIFLSDYIMSHYKYAQSFLHFQNFYNKYAGFATFIAGFTPIPYKVATIASGTFKANIFIFLIASILSRGLRFFLLAIMIKFYHNKGREVIVKNFKLLVTLFGILIFVLVVMYGVFWK